MSLGDLRGLSLSGFSAIVGAWNRAHDPDAENDISDVEVRELSAWLDSVQVMGSA